MRHMLFFAALFLAFAAAGTSDYQLAAAIAQEQAATQLAALPQEPPACR